MTMTTRTIAPAPAMWHPRRHSCWPCAVTWLDEPDCWVCGAPGTHGGLRTPITSQSSGTVLQPWDEADLDRCTGPTP